MTNDATLAPTDAIEPPPPPRMGVVTSEPMPAPRIPFDSEAFDLATMRTTEISALASCVMCLTAVESANTSFDGYELTKDALPLLGGVIMRLAHEADLASRQLWAQYENARAIANGHEVQQ